MIDSANGNTTTPSSVSSGAIQLNTGVANDLVLGGQSASLSKLGLVAATDSTTRNGTNALGGPPALTLTIPAVNNNTTATNIVFGTGPNQVSTLAQLNTALAGNSLQATIDNTGALTIVTSNDAGSTTIGTLGGTAAATGKLFAGLAGQAPVIDPASQATRQNLVAQYNNVITQITTTSQDSSFNGINLLAGDTLKLTFNETGKSTLNIQGTTLTPAGLGLRPLGTADFLDNTSANNTLASLNGASTILRSQASSLGSNLSIVQIRQDFAKNLINVLQTGSSNLTLADTNEEAANSQALSTPAIDRGLRAGARQPVTAKRAEAAPVSPHDLSQICGKRRGKPRRFHFVCLNQTRTNQRKDPCCRNYPVCSAIFRPGWLVQACAEHGTVECQVDGSMQIRAIDRAGKQEA